MRKFRPGRNHAGRFLHGSSCLGAALLAEGEAEIAVRDAQKRKSRFRSGGTGSLKRNAGAAGFA